MRRKLVTPYANNKGAEQSQCLISAFVICCLDSVIQVLNKSKMSRLLLVSVAEQASLSLTWWQTPQRQVFCDMAQLHFFFFFRKTP